ncbi:hypothetical protein VTK26DRAFT_102 [Humicola hyalothermophila]
MPSITPPSRPFGSPPMGPRVSTFSSRVATVCRSSPARGQRCVDDAAASQAAEAAGEGETRVTPRARVESTSASGATRAATMDAGSGGVGVVHELDWCAGRVGEIFGTGGGWKEREGRAGGGKLTDLLDLSLDLVDHLGKGLHVHGEGARDGYALGLGALRGGGQAPRSRCPREHNGRSRPPHGR